MSTKRKRIVLYLLAPSVAAAWAWAVLAAADSGEAALVVLTVGPLALLWIYSAALALVWIAIRLGILKEDRRQ